MALSDGEVRELVDRLDTLLGRLERAGGPVAELAAQAVAALTEVYGAALARALAVAGGAQRMVEDELLHHLLALHGLHPHPVEDRIRRALGEVRLPGGTVELTGVRDGVAVLRLSGAGGCGARALTDAVLAAAPELRDVQTVTGPAPPALIPAESLLRPRSAGP